MTANSMDDRVFGEISPARTVTVVLATLALGTPTLAWFTSTAWRAGTHPDRLSAAELVVAVLCGLGSIVVLWLLAAVLWSVHTISRGAQTTAAPRTTPVSPAAPVGLRRLVAVLLGVGAGAVIGGGTAWADNGLTGPAPATVGLTAVGSAQHPPAATATSGPVLVPTHAPTTPGPSAAASDAGTAERPTPAPSSVTVAVPDPLPAPAGTVSPSLREGAMTSAADAAGPKSTATASPAATVPTSPSPVLPSPASPSPASPSPTSLGPAPTAGSEGGAETTGAAGWVVRPGDTLWGIAAATLPAGSGPADVAAQWPRWYAANRATIGADPNLILPGQRLVAPSDGADR